MASRLRITLERSLIGRPPNQRATVKALGLKRLHQSVEKADSPTIRGMVRTVDHLVRVDTVERADA